MIYIMAHKPFDAPGLPGYVPMQVGAARNADLGYLRDDTGDNISEKNPHYCELTGLYWVWKNCDDEVKGLAHYRRYLTRGQLAGGIVPLKRFERDLRRVDLVLPRRFYHPDKTNGEQLVPRYCEERYFRALREIVRERHPDDLAAFDAFFEDSRGYFFNMLVARRERFDDYCAWLFDILFTLEARIAAEWPQDEPLRLYGYLSERLLNVYLRGRSLRIATYPMTIPEWTLKRRALELYRSVKKRLRYALRPVH